MFTEKKLIGKGEYEVFETVFDWSTFWGFILTAILTICIIHGCAS